MIIRCGICRVNPVVDPDEDWAYLTILNKNYKVYICNECVNKVIKFEKEAS